MFVVFFLIVLPCTRALLKKLHPQSLESLDPDHFFLPVSLRQKIHPNIFLYMGNFSSKVPPEKVAQRIKPKLQLAHLF